jgi:hypothetical protein
MRPTFSASAAGHGKWIMQKRYLYNTRREGVRNGVSGEKMVSLKKSLRVAGLLDMIRAS